MDDSDSKSIQLFPQTISGAFLYDDEPDQQDAPLEPPAPQDIYEREPYMPENYDRTYTDDPYESDPYTDSAYQNEYRDGGYLDDVYGNEVYDNDFDRQPPRQRQYQPEPYSQDPYPVESRQYERADEPRAAQWEEPAPLPYSYDRSNADPYASPYDSPYEPYGKNAYSEQPPRSAQYDEPGYTDPVFGEPRPWSMQKPKRNQKDASRAAQPYEQIPEVVQEQAANTMQWQHDMRKTQGAYFANSSYDAAQDSTRNLPRRQDRYAPDSRPENAWQPQPATALATTERRIVVPPIRDEKTGAPEAKTSVSTFAIVGLVLGAAALLTCYVPLINNISLIAGVAGLALSIVGLIATIRRNKRGRTLAIAGTAVSAVAIVAVIIVQAVFSDALDQVFGTDSFTFIPAISANANTADATSSSNTENASKSSSASPSSSSNPNYSDLPIGTPAEYQSGLFVCVDAIKEGIVNSSGTRLTEVTVTYTNGGSSQEAFNSYDWRGEDAKGVQRTDSYFSEATNELKSGTLAPGGSITGNIYFEGELKRIVFESSFLNRRESASWLV